MAPTIKAIGAAHRRLQDAKRPYQHSSAAGGDVQGLFWVVSGLRSVLYKGAEATVRLHRLPNSDSVLEAVNNYAAARQELVEAEAAAWKEVSGG